MNIDRAALPSMSESDYFLVLLVNARHLDYSCEKTFIKTMQKHPDDCSKSGDVGHAWIYLQGVDGQESVFLEGGQTGDFGNIQAKYFDGVMNYMDYGYSNPTPEEIKNPCFEPNPIKYLWESQKDGVFHYGCGGHTPTFAAKVNLTPEQYQKIRTFIAAYDFSDYSLTGNQCTSFVVQIAALAGLDLECQMTMPVSREIQFGGERLVLWRDPCFSTITFSTPDVLEKSLIKAVCEGRAEYALPWWKNRAHYNRAKKTKPANRN